VIQAHDQVGNGDAGRATVEEIAQEPQRSRAAAPGRAGAEQGSGFDQAGVGQQLDQLGEVAVYVADDVGGLGHG
jgi:hypothetical protein